MYHKWWIYQEVYLKKYNKWLLDKYLKQIKRKEKPLFIHINKTGGTSITKSLGFTEAHYTLKEYETLFKTKFNIELPQDTDIWTAIRNPFDKVSSQYFYRLKNNQNNLANKTLSFDEWVRAAYDDKDPFYRDSERMFSQQGSWIESDSARPIEFIRFENLSEDYKMLSLKYDGKPLKWLKKSNNKNYKELYSSYSKRIIENEFSDDLLKYKYSYL